MLSDFSVKAAVVLLLISIFLRIIGPDRGNDLEPDTALKKIRYCLREMVYFVWKDLRPKPKENWFQRYVVRNFQMLF